MSGYWKIIRGDARTGIPDRQVWVDDGIAASKASEAYRHNEQVRMQQEMDKAFILRQRKLIPRSIIERRIQNHADKLMHIFDLHGASSHFERDELYLALLTHLRRDDDLYYRYRAIQKHEESLKEMIQYELERLLTIYKLNGVLSDLTEGEYLRFWINTNLAVLPKIRLEEPMSEIDVAIRNSVSLLTEMFRPFKQFSDQEREEFASELLPWVNKNRAAFVILSYLYDDVPPHRPFIDRFMAYFCEENQFQLLMLDELKKTFQLGSLYNPLNISDVAEKYRVELNRLGKNEQNRIYWELGGEVAIGQQQANMTLPIHNWCYLSPKVEEGFNAQWALFKSNDRPNNVLHTKSNSSGTLSQAQSMRQPKSIRNRKVAAWGASLGASLVASLLVINDTHLVTTEVSVTATTNAELAPIDILPIPNTVQIIVDPNQGCMFDQSEITVPNGGLIRFSSNVPVDLKSVDNVFSPLPTLVLDKIHTMEVDGTTELQLNYPRHSSLLRPDIEFVCEASGDENARSGPLLQINPIIK